MFGFISHSKGLQTAKEDIKRRDEKLDAVEPKLCIAEGKLSEALEKNRQMINEADKQAGITAFIGRTLGSMVWRTSQVEGVIDIFIKKVGSAPLLVRNITELLPGFFIGIDRRFHRTRICVYEIFHRRVHR